MQAEAASERSLPWELRAGLALPLPSAVLGVLLASALFGVQVLLHGIWGYPVWDFDEPGAYANGLAHAALVGAILVAYTIASSAYFSVVAARDLRGLVSDAFIARVGPRGVRVLGTGPRALRGSRLAGAAGFGLGLVLIFGPPAMGDPDPLHRSFRDTAWVAAVLLVFFWLFARTVYLGVHRTRELARLAREELEVDLFDLRPLDAFGRVSLRLSLLFSIGGSLLVLLELADPIDRTLPLIVIVIGGTVAFALAVLVIPVRGVRRRIRAAKRAELDRLTDALRALREAPGAEPGRIADLVALRSYVEGVREWPFDAPTLRRFGLYLLIPLGSWLGGAFVERLLGAALD